MSKVSVKFDKNRLHHLLKSTKASKEYSTMTRVAAYVGMGICVAYLLVIILLGLLFVAPVVLITICLDKKTKQGRL